MVKICKKCGLEFPIDNFYKSKTTKDGTSIRCKQCIKQYYEKNKDVIAKHRREYYKNNKETRNEYAKEYYKNNKEKVDETKRLYLEKNKEKYTNYAKIYKKTNKEHISICKRKDYKEHKEMYNACSRKYYEKNKEKFQMYNKKYKETHKGKYLVLGSIASQKRRALKAKTISTFTKKQWESTKTIFNNKCCYCGKEKNLTMEHFVPLSKLGEFTINNIIPSCLSCNSSKGKKDFHLWYPTYKYYSKKRENTLLRYLGYNNNAQQLKII